MSARAALTQASQPTHPQPFPESFCQCHLILRKVKAAAVERDSVVLEGRGTDAPTLKTKDLNKLHRRLQTHELCYMLEVGYSAA